MELNFSSCFLSVPVYVRSGEFKQTTNIGQVMVFIYFNNLVIEIQKKDKGILAK